MALAGVTAGGRRTAGAMDVALAKRLREIRACRLCAAELAHEPRPVLQADVRARILVAGQAPGRKVHASGRPFDDVSGDRLREWMGVDRRAFYDPEFFAIIPMGFCYPGTGEAGDLPPRPECAPAWRDGLLRLLSRVELTLAIGKYAHDYHLEPGRRSVADAVAAWREIWPSVVPMPHPSPRNRRWLQRNPGFQAEVVPAVQRRIRELLPAPVVERLRREIVANRA